jgi:acyl carrier protein
MDFQQFLKNFCGQFEDGNVEIKGTDKLRKIESWDSLTAMAILYMIEQDYNVKIPVEDFKKLETPQAIFDYVNARAKL